MIDHEKRVKDVMVVEGGYLDVGFERYLIRLEIIDKDEKSCITKSTIEYDIKEDYAANASLVSIHPLMVVMNLAAIHILAKTNWIGGLLYAFKIFKFFPEASLCCNLVGWF